MGECEYTGYRYILALPFTKMGRVRGNGRLSSDSLSKRSQVGKMENEQIKMLMPFGFTLYL